MAAMLGIDFGNSTSKASVKVANAANVTGHSISNLNFSIPSLISFGLVRRFIGHSAKALESYNFMNTVGSLKRLAGRAISDESISLTERRFISAPLINTTGIVGIKVDGRKDGPIFLVTQLVAMFLRRFIDIASLECPRDNSNIVVAVPVWYTSVQRRAVLDASFIAGLQRVGLVNDTTAIALNYGMHHTDLVNNGTSHNVMFVDLGESDYSVTIATFSQGQLLIRSVCFDSCFGGRDVDYALAVHFAEEFKHSHQIDTLDDPKAYWALLTECKVVKETLTSMDTAEFRFASVMKNISSKSELTRQSFEKIASPFLSRIPRLLQESLSKAGLTSDQIQSIELVGGSTSIPSVSDCIQAFFQGKPLSTTLDREHAVAEYASTTLAAQPCHGFFTLEDTGPYPFKFAWNCSLVSLEWDDRSDDYRPDTINSALASLKEREEMMHASDLLVSETEGEHISLLEYMRSMRDALDEIYAEYSNPEDKSKLLQGIENAEEWLNSAQAEEMTKLAYDSRYNMLRTLSQPISERYKEVQDLAVCELRQMSCIVLGLVVEEGLHSEHIRPAAEFSADALAWLDEKLTTQAQTLTSVDAVLRVKDITCKSKELIRKLALPQKGKVDQRETLNKKMQVLQQVLQCLAEDSPLYAESLFSFGVAFQLLSAESQKEQDIDDSIAWLSRAVLLTPDGHPDKTSRLDTLGNSLYTRFILLGSMSDIDKAISCFEDAVSMTTNVHPHRPILLNNLAVSLRGRFKRLGNLADINKAISSQEEAVRIMRDADVLSNKASQLSNLGNTFLARFEQLGEISDLDQAISNHEEAIRITPDGHPARAVCFNNLGSALYRRFERRGKIVDVDRAISHYEEAVRITTTGHPTVALYSSNLGSSFLGRFERLGEIGDLDKAMLNLDNAVRITPDGHSDKPGWLNNLANSLSKRFERLGSITDVDKAISNFEVAVRLTPNGDIALPGYLNNLGDSLSRRFERFGRFLDLNTALSSYERAMLLTPHGHPDKPACLNNIGSSLLTRYAQVGETADIEGAVSNLEQAVRITPDKHPEKQVRFSNLGNSFMKYFEHSGEIALINKAISNHEEAVRLTPDGHPDKPTRFNNIGCSLLLRFKRLGEIADLNKAIWNFKEGVRTTPDGHPDKPVRSNNLGISYLNRFERVGDVIDLDNAISSHEEALNMIPDGHLAKPACLNDFGNSLMKRFQRLGDIADLERAILNHKDAVRITSEGHPAKPTCLSNLGGSLLARFELLGDVADINNAISSREEAVCITPHGHASKPEYLSGLGNVFFIRFERLGQISDIEKAISTFEEAVNITSDNHPAKALRLNNLGISFLKRFERLWLVVDINQSISSLEDAVHMTPDGHAAKPTYLKNLGTSFSVRFKSLGLTKDQEQCISTYSAAACSSTGAASVRFDAAVSWSKQAQFSNDPSVLEAFTTALELLPQVAWLGLSVDSRHRELRAAVTVACDAAATALMAHDSQKALAWLEQGRSIVWGQTLQLRTPLDDLRESHYKLADELARVSEALERESPQDALTGSRISADQELSFEQVAQRHRQLTKEWEDLVEQVRRQPGFERFLRPKQYSQLRHAAIVGPVIVLNISRLRCDAIILVSPSESLRHIQLDKFSYKRAQELQYLLRNLLSSLRLRDRNNERHGRPMISGFGDADETFRAILAELWTSLVNPLLNCLPFQRSASQDLPRIWWCPTGPLTFLPIHAAGLYPRSGMGPRMSLADFAISSYTPTLNALLDAFRPFSQQEFRLLAVIQPSTPGASTLPGTVEELERIRERASGLSTLVLERTDATVAEVMSRMRECTWVHFACHGVQDIAYPTKSGLLLQDGRLELSRIITKPIPHADFAFLSACQTATGDESHPDEAIHLAAGMLLAGYRGVVATMWSIQDKDAPSIADDLYAHLFRDGQPKSINAAQALHIAVACLQEGYGGRSFASWVPFVHVGV